MAVVDSINNLTDKISGFGDSIVSVFSYVISIFKTLWYGLTSLLTGVRDLIVDVRNGNIGIYLGSTFGQLVDYLGGPPVVFIASLLLIIIFRIGLAFVFKILRLNIDYHSLNEKNRVYEQHAKFNSKK